ncbi:GMP synthase-like protein [Daphnia magna]|uniref:GMP synthase-like protein n=1 Tax=Daphnia magna TaxID=35525 RepID=A0A164JEC2_9CRUS|nr:GMP synthase-like protein [Daphnia magna]
MSQTRAIPLYHTGTTYARHLICMYSRCVKLSNITDTDKSVKYRYRYRYIECLYFAIYRHHYRMVTNPTLTVRAPSNPQLPLCFNKGPNSVYAADAPTIRPSNLYLRSSSAGNLICLYACNCSTRN